MTKTTKPTLADVRRALAKSYGKAPGLITDDPFGLILWEQVGYLVDDEQRAAAFGQLVKRTKLVPHKILAVPPDDLLAIARAGGATAAEDRANRMRETAHIVVDDYAGDLAYALKVMTPRARVRTLKRFASIGTPGAEKILLFAKLERLLGLESNGLRVLVRIGFAAEEKSYDKTWRAARAATSSQLPSKVDEVVELHQLLRRHGQTVCTRTAPRCPTCKVRSMCSYGC